MITLGIHGSRRVRCVIVICLLARHKEVVFGHQRRQMYDYYGLEATRTPGNILPLAYPVHIYRFVSPPKSAISVNNPQNS